MREIKFRAWDKDNEEMIYFYLFDTDRDYHIEAEMSLEEMPIMQYTGRNDKNGKEIYGGDILRYSIDGHIQATPYVIEDVIDWCEEMYDPDSYCRWDDLGEIIGNKFENPELMT